MAEKLFNERIFQLKTFDFSTDPNPYYKRQETVDQKEQFEDREIETFPICVHGHVIKSPEQMGGLCICGAPLCKECAAQ